MKTIDETSEIKDETSKKIINDEASNGHKKSKIKALRLTWKSFLSVLIVAFIFSISVIFAYFFFNQEKPLPIYQPAQIHPDLVDESLQQQQKSHRIAPFTLQNQYGETVTEAIVAEKVYVAEFFFATCPDICLLMNAQMQRIAQFFKDENRFRILSFSVYPEKDTPENLLIYSQNYQAKLPQWTFLTGDKPQIYNLARRSYFLMKKEAVGFDKAEENGSASDFIHTNNFVLIDTKNRIRGYYDGTSAQEVDQLIKDIQKLLKEN